MDDSKLPAPFRIEHLCYLPYNLAKTELVVRPVVALLHSSTDPASPSADESLIPRLDAKEVAAVFSAPFHNFLMERDEVPSDGGDAGDDTEAMKKNKKLPPGDWYQGSWTFWHETPWRMHYFYVPLHDQRVTRPRVRDGGQAALAEDGEEEEEEEDDNDARGGEREGARASEGKKLAGRFKVWGMTARILVDAATVAYGEIPEFEHNAHFGDEKMIVGLEKMGRLGDKKKPGSELTHNDLKEASKM